MTNRAEFSITDKMTILGVSLGRTGPKTYRLLADCTFEAESIDDAFKKLEDHFRALQEEMPDDERLFTSGEINISPLDVMDKKDIYRQPKSS